MTGRIIRLHGDPHQETQALLPWYVTGQLDASDQAQVEAHLGHCPECQAELRIERSLQLEIAGLSIDAEHSWAQLQRRREFSPPRRRYAATVGGWLRAAGRGAGRQWRSSAAGLRWAVAAQFLLIVVLGVLVLPTARPARYHALGAAPVAASGNAVVIFRPDTSERNLRQALRSSHARVVDGPTSADAFVIHIPPAERTAALAMLRRRGDIELAEPVDSSEPR
jgi:anti-sigma factor RsiW